VTDINLKGKMDGWEVARQARMIDPEFPIHLHQRSKRRRLAIQGVPKSIMLSKPFAPAQLVTAVAQLLNGGMPPTTQGAPASRFIDAFSGVLKAEMRHEQVWPQAQ
jgi:DNA-binding NarL/FixJ family response regulator